METKNRYAKLRPDKFLGDNYFRHMFIGHVKSGTSEHEYRDVKYFPEDIFEVEDDGGEKIFFIPIMLVHDLPDEKNIDVSEKKPLPVPIFMLEFEVKANAAREEIKRIAKKRGLIIIDKYFQKPIMAMCYGERIDQGFEEVDEETIERIEIKTTFSKKRTRLNPYHSSEFNHMH